MKSYDYNAYAYGGEVYCINCLPNPTEYLDLDKDERPYPIFADSEWDYYPSCSVCGLVHDYVGLTDYGREVESNQERLNRQRNRKYYYTAQTTGNLTVVAYAPTKWGAFTTFNQQTTFRARLSTIEKVSKKLLNQWWGDNWPEVCKWEEGWVR